MKNNELNETETTLTKEIKEPKKTTSPKKMSLSKTLDLDSAKLLLSLKDRANKKPHGRKIRDFEIIAVGLSLIQPEHLMALQEQSLTEKDRLNIAHDEYQKANGKITLDQFIGKLIRGEISLTRSPKA